MDSCRAVDNASGREPLRVVRNEGPGGVAARVVGRVAARFFGGASETTEVARGKRRHAAKRLVCKELDRCLAVFDGIDIVTVVSGDEAGAGGVIGGALLAAAAHLAGESLGLST